MESTEDITGRKRAQEALELAAKRFELVTSATQDALYDWDLVSHEIWRNENYRRMFGAPERSLDSDNWWVDRLHPEDRKRVLTAQDAAFVSGSNLFSPEYRLRRPDGSYVDIIERSLIVRDAQGQVVKMIGALTDITEQRRAEEALRTSEQRYRELFENATDIVFTYDLQGNFTSVNRAGEHSSGYSRTELTTMNVLQILAPEYVAQGRRVLAGLAAGRESGIGEWEIVAKDGRRVRLEASLRLVRRNGELAEVQGIARDITERKQAEEALEKSAQLLKDTGEMARVGGWELDLSTKEVSWTDEVARIHGVGPGSRFKLDEALSFYAPESRPSVESAMKKAAETGEPYDLESLLIPRGSADKIWVRSLGQAVWGGDKVVKLVGTFQDIDKYKKAEQALRESEKLYRLLAENVTDVIWITDLDFRYTYISPSVTRLRGVTVEEAMAEKIEETLTPSSLEVAKRALAEELSKENTSQEDPFRSRTLEVEQICKDGSTVWTEVRSTFLRNSEGRPVGILGVTRDISARRRAEEALRESEARFRAVFENAAIAIALVDMHGYPVESNLALQKMLGYNKTELAQMAFTQVTHPDDVQASWDLFSQLCEGKRDRYQLEKRYCRRDGQIVWGQLTESLVRSENGEPQYAIAMIEDISERKRAVEALRQLSGRLLRLQDDERRRIARELHDTTAQSLAALATNLTVVKDSAPDLSPRARTCLSESLELADECSREIRTLSYLLHPPLLEEAGLCSALRWFVDGYTQRTGIHVDLEMPPELTRLPGDVELALYRVVQEGLTNIHLHSGSKKAHVCLKCNPNQAVLTVADEGRGLPPGLLERGGQRGARLGVGIPGMRERIRQLGGQFEIITGSKGTTLTASVPLGKDRA